MALSTIPCPPCDLIEITNGPGHLPKFTFGEFTQLAKTNAILEMEFTKKDTGKRSRNTITRLALIA